MLMSYTYRNETHTAWLMYLKSNNSDDAQGYHNENIVQRPADSQHNVPNIAVSYSFLGISLFEPRFTFVIGYYIF
jgi:hypothetical protein